ncbi:glycosyltransferase family 8 protein [Hoeflea poritis]|uniref:Glycosyltransferase family 8 protein n=1 Tax=Hoeflea poritis TaxID=2993659 RepID=A0ABT4VPW2_9HYPH|nr:glycosyltransferase family 8 protein [Hoeflea poritis]MDA4846745.1 glycosyltransferase family 8 protein [Hoeflea poritis]
MNILIAPDNDVIAPTCVLLNSLRLNHPDIDIVVYLLWCDLTAENRKHIEDYAATIGLTVVSYRLDPVRVRPIFNRIPPTDLTISCLLRCFAGEILPESVGRIVYLDTDLVVAAPITELYDTRLKGNIAAAVLNPGHAHLETHGVGEDAYFNSGVLLIDLDLWRQNDVDRQLQSFLTSHPESCRYFDQCALNVALRGKVLALDNRWNVMGSLKDASHFTSVSIIHYSGDVKPWRNPESHPYGIFYCNYSKGTPWPQRYRYKLLRQSNPFIFRTRTIFKKAGRRLTGQFGRPSARKHR